MNVLVTGGMGFIGSNLTDALLAKGCMVTVIDNWSTANYEKQKEYLIELYKYKNFRFGYADLEFAHEAHWDSWISGFDVIYHLAALPRIQPSFNFPAKTLAANCQGTVNVLEIAKKQNSKLIYAGSSSFYGDPSTNPYAHSKWIGEEHCKMYNKVFGVPVAIARFFNVYGMRQVGEGQYATLMGIFEHQKRNKLPLTITGDGTKTRDFTNVSDIVNGLIAMSEKNWNGEIFNLGRGRNYSINEVAQMFKPDKIEYIPNRPGEAQDTLADLSFSLANLNWKPEVNLPEYVDSFLRTL